MHQPCLADMLSALQGYWPDGIYTAATHDALLYDMRVAHALGFTTLRTHMKVAPDRYYHHADRIGMLIWQDMPAMYWVSTRLQCMWCIQCSETSFATLTCTMLC